MVRPLCPSLVQQILPEHSLSARLCWALGHQSLKDTVVPALEESAEGQCTEQLWSLIPGLCLVTATAAHRTVLAYTCHRGRCPASLLEQKPRPLLVIPRASKKLHSVLSAPIPPAISLSSLQ